jgi:hypothetical protein
MHLRLLSCQTLLLGLKLHELPLLLELLWGRLLLVQRLLVHGLRSAEAKHPTTTRVRRHHGSHTTTEGSSLAATKRSLLPKRAHPVLTTVHQTRDRTRTGNTAATEAGTNEPKAEATRRGGARR